MNRRRTMPHTVITAKSQHSSSHHLPRIRSTAYCQFRIGIRSVSSLGEKSQRGLSSPRGAWRAHRRTAGFCGPSAMRVTERQLLGDLALDDGIGPNHGHVVREAAPRSPARA